MITQTIRIHDWIERFPDGCPERVRIDGCRVCIDGGDSRVSVDLDQELDLPSCPLIAADASVTSITFCCSRYARVDSRHELTLLTAGAELDRLEAGVFQALARSLVPVFDRYGNTLTPQRSFSPAAPLERNARTFMWYGHDRTPTHSLTDLVVVIRAAAGKVVGRKSASSSDANWLGQLPWAELIDNPRLMTAPGQWSRLVKPSTSGQANAHY